jgi:hypothetical protein
MLYYFARAEEKALKKLAKNPTISGYLSCPI